jgi:hypothetical protein
MPRVWRNGERLADRKVQCAEGRNGAVAVERNHRQFHTDVFQSREG